MGVTIKANNAKCDFDMGAGGFFNLRKNVAYALDPELGANYEKLSRCYTSEDYKAHDKEAERIINSKRLWVDYDKVLDFLYASDIEGTINYKTGKQIADLLTKDLPRLKTKTFRYAIRAGHDYEDFIAFLNECYSHRRNIHWS